MAAMAAMGSSHVIWPPGGLVHWGIWPWDELEVEVILEVEFHPIYELLIINGIPLYIRIDGLLWIDYGLMMG